MTRLLFPRWLIDAALCAIMLVACAPAAPSWPARPVRLIVPAPAGSSLDVVARSLSEKLRPV